MSQVAVELSLREVYRWLQNNDGKVGLIKRNKPIEIPMYKFSEIKVNKRNAMIRCINYIQGLYQ